MANNKNICAVLRAKNDLRLEVRPIPVPASHEVLISVQDVGICGSDVHYWKRGGIGDFIVKEPMILGHETSGVVTRVGSEVKNLVPGDRVCIEPGVPCRICDFCKKGRYNLCPDIKFCATPPYDGSLCNFYCHDAHFCYKLPNHVSFEEGALVEPLSVAVHACKRAGVSAGDSVLICGAGPIGLVNLLVAKAMGATKICITDKHSNRLEVARTMGATYQVNVRDCSHEDALNEILDKLGAHPDIAIECSGSGRSVKLGIKALKRGGRIVLVGLGEPELKLPIVDATVREVDIRGVFRYANCYPIALELVSSGSVNLKPMITHHYGLKDMLRAFETAHNFTDCAIKVIISCSDNKI